MSELAPIALKFPYGATVVGGGPCLEGDLEDALAVAPGLVCADGGADAIGGRRPDALIGDMDSVRDAAAWRRELGDRFVEIAEQDSTDLEKCLRLASAPFFVGVGFIGRRIDHSLAAMHALLADDRPIALIGERDVVFAAHRPFRLKMAPGERISFFPLSPVRAVRGSGLRWPIDGLEMRAGRTIGTSNAATGVVEAAFDGPGAVVITPRDRFSDVVNALRLSSGASQL